MKQRIWKEAESHRGRQEQSHIGEAEVIRRNEKIRVRMLKVREREREREKRDKNNRESCSTSYERRKLDPRRYSIYCVLETCAIR